MHYFNFLSKNLTVKSLTLFLAFFSPLLVFGQTFTGTGGSLNNPGVTSGVRTYPVVVSGVSGSTFSGGICSATGDVIPDIDVPAIVGYNTEITNITLTNVQHTFAADLDLRLISPNGTTITFNTDNGGSTGLDIASDVCFDITSTDCADTWTSSSSATQPENCMLFETSENNCGPLTIPFVFGCETSTMAGLANGTWTLEITDDAGGDTGSFTNFSITFGPMTPPTTDSGGATIDFLDCECSAVCEPTFTGTGGSFTSAGTTSGVVTYPVSVSGVCGSTFSGGTCSGGAVIPDIDIPAIVGYNTEIKNITLTNAQHTFAADLDLRLISPNGTTITFNTDNGGSTGLDIASDVCFDITSTNCVDTWTSSSSTTQPENCMLFETSENNCGPLTIPFVFDCETSTMAGLANGTWTLEITDDAGGDTGSFTDFSITFGPMTPPTTDSGGTTIDFLTCECPINPEITGTFELCPGYEAFLDAGEYDTTPNEYAWSNGQTTQTITTATAGIYSVTVTTANGSTGIASVETTDICNPFVTGLAVNGDTICPGDDIVTTVTDYQMMTYSHDYTLTYVLFDTDNLGNTTYNDNNDTGVFATPAPGDYTVCAYNELTDCQPSPSPNTSNVDDLADVGTLMDGCFTYDCTTLTVPEPFEFDLDNATFIPNVGTGNNVYVAELCGGTLPYSLAFSSTPSEIFATVNQLPSPSGPNCINIQVLFGNGADWSVTVTDAHGCSDSVLDSDSALDSYPLLEIYSFDATNETGIGQNDGTLEVTILGGDDSCGTYSYDWSGPGYSSSNAAGSTTGDEITGLASGTYTVTVTDCAGSTQVDNVFLQRDRRRGGRGRGRGRSKTVDTQIEGISNSLMVAPNPFAGQTVIAFATPKTENVSVDVFTVNGQHVANLFEGVLESTQSVIFDGSKLQTGTYIVRLLTEAGEIQYQKVVLMR